MTYNLLKCCSLVLLFSITISSCDSNNKTIVETSHIEVDFELVDFHNQLKTEGNLADHIQILNKKYPSFSPLFFDKVLPIRDNEGNLQEEMLKDEGFENIIDTCTIIFDDLSSIEAEFKKAFQYYTYHTEDYNIPNIYLFVSGFAYQTFIFQDGQKDGLGIGLDMFLGRNFPYKDIDRRNDNFSSYLTFFFDKENLVRKSLFTWLDDKIPASQSPTLLDIMIRNGKMLYILENLLPTTQADIIHEYKEEQYQWCLENEVAIWSHLLKENLLYEGDFMKIHKFVNPSPNVPGIPAQAPGGVANYIGFRIVQDYMNRSASTINDLMVETNAIKIFEESRYKPRNRN